MSKAVVYLASPFFNEKEVELKKRIIKKLSEQDYYVIDPQGGGKPRSWEESNFEWGARIFQKDLDLIKDADYVVAIDWGLYSDTGTAVEIGYAYAHNKKVIVIVPDETLNQKHSLMVANATKAFVCESRFFDFTDNIENLEYFYLYGVEQK